MAADVVKLREIAVAVRQILEEASPTTPDSPFQRFPRGACGPTAELLGRYVTEVLDLDALYVGVRRSDGFTHAWVTVNNVIVDITADQFGQEPVIVARESAWHNQWSTEDPRPPISSPEQWLIYPHYIWDAILKGMGARGHPVSDST